MLFFVAFRLGFLEVAFFFVDEEVGGQGSEDKAIVSNGVYMSDESFVPINSRKVPEFKREFLKNQGTF